MPRPFPCMLVAPWLTACLGQTRPPDPDDSAPPADSADSNGPDDTGDSPGGDVATVWDPTDFYTVYDVGPGQALAEPDEVPWDELEAGTLVRIHWREEPYRRKWAIVAEGWENHPIVVLGVPDAGRLPVITGEDALTIASAHWLDQDRSVIQIGGSNEDDVGSWIWLQDLEVRSARPGYAFTDAEGGAGAYAADAAAVRIGQAAHARLEGLDLHDAELGLTSGAGAEDLLVRRSWLHDLGTPGSAGQAGAAVESRGVTWEFDRFGPLAEGVDAAALLDRSAGLVVRYCWFEGGGAQLSLHRANEPAVADDPAHQRAFVYGNVFYEPDGDGPGRFVVLGEPSASATWRPGDLYLYQNTFLSERSEATTLLEAPDAAQRVEARSNLVHRTVAEAALKVVVGAGAVVLADNWLTEGWVPTGGNAEHAVDDQGNLSGSDPGFVDLAGRDLHLAATSPCQGAAGAPPADAAEHPVAYQYVAPQGGEIRTSTDDIGAFEDGS